MDKDTEKAERDNASEPKGPAEVTYEEARAARRPAAAPEEAQFEPAVAAHPEDEPSGPESISGPAEDGPETAVPKEALTGARCPRGRPRKGKESGTRWTCPLCNKNLSSGTKSHVCRPKENVPPAPVPASLRHRLRSPQRQSRHLRHHRGTSISKVHPPLESLETTSRTSCMAKCVPAGMPDVRG